VECRLPENHKSCRSNNQVRIKFIVDKNLATAYKNVAMQSARNKGRLGRGDLASLLYHYVEVSPNTITNPEKRNNYSTYRFKEKNVFRDVESVLN